MQSNYERMKQQTRQDFLKYDQEEIIRRFHLEADDRYLSFVFLGGKCRVDRKTGDVECFEDGRFREADYNEAMTVYDLLCWSKPGAVPSGEYVNLKSLSGLYSASAPLGSGGFWMKEAKLLDHRDEELRGAMLRAGGEPAAGGDAAAEFEVFCGMKVRFTYWNSDDEFDPEIQFYWDKNVLFYMHYETLYFAGGVLLGRIRREMEK